MKIANIAAVPHKAAIDMQAFAARNDDLDLPEVKLRRKGWRSSPRPYGAVQLAENPHANRKGRSD